MSGETEHKFMYVKPPLNGVSEEDSMFKAKMALREKSWYVCGQEWPLNEEIALKAMNDDQLQVRLRKMEVLCKSGMFKKVTKRGPGRPPKVA